MQKTPDSQTREENVATLIGEKAARRRRAKSEGRHGLWFGIGMFGLVGWAVAVPTVAGILLGLWLETAVPAGFSWTLSGLAGGVILGSINAWWWVSREGRISHESAASDKMSDEAEQARRRGPAASSGEDGS